MQEQNVRWQFVCLKKMLNKRDPLRRWGRTIYRPDWRLGKEEEEEEEDEEENSDFSSHHTYWVSASVNVNAIINPCGRGEKQTIYALGHGWGGEGGVRLLLLLLQAFGHG